MIKLGERQFEAASLESESAVHSPFMPTEVRKGDGIEGEITLTFQDVRVTRSIDVWTMSPLGIEFVSDLEGITTGTEVALTLKVLEQECRFHGLLVSSAGVAAGKRIYGIRWCTPPSEERVGERRTSKRWVCSPEFMPSGMAPNPAKFDDYLLFRVKDLSLKGMQIQTSLRNKLLVPGMRISSTIHFPLFGQLQVGLRIVNANVVSEGGKDFLSLGTEIVDADQSVREIMGQYILQFGTGASVTELKQNQFPIRSVIRSLEFSYVRTAEDFREVLKLRKLCYSLAGKVSAEHTIEQLSDGFDTRSRILMVHYRGELVGTARITYPERDTITEHEQYVPFPDHFPPREKMVDASRLCTHPDYRGSDLILAMIRNICMATVPAGRRWIIGSSTEKLLPLYQAVGLRSTGVRYSHKELGSSDHIIFMIDTHAVLEGRQINPIVWNAMYADFAAYFASRGIVRYSPATLARQSLLRLLGPISKAIFYKRLRAPRKRRRAA